MVQKNYERRDKMARLSVWKVAAITWVISILLIAILTLFSPAVMGNGLGSIYNFIANVGTLALFVFILSGGYALLKRLFRKK